MNAGTVSVGAGQAGSDMASTLPQIGHPGRSVLVGDEPAAPYRRPTLSKAVLSGDVAEDTPYIKTREAYANYGIERRGGLGVDAIDCAAHVLKAAGSSPLADDKLAVTTGDRPRRLDLPGADSPNLHYVGTIDDIRYHESETATDIAQVFVDAYRLSRKPMMEDVVLRPPFSP